MTIAPMNQALPPGVGLNPPGVAPLHGPGTLPVKPPGMQPMDVPAWQKEHLAKQAAHQQMLNALGGPTKYW